MNEIERLRGASNRYADIAQDLHDEGFVKEAEFGFSAAASIDLEDAELQNCWGGPFNGQAARCDLVQKIIQLWNPAAIVEAGTFRGVTTEWLAQATSAPIYSCEKNKRFFLQSKQRLAKWTNIHLDLQDSRDFIRQIAATDVSKKKVLFYLDAHWEQDLPLREEIALIFKLFKSPCVIVDDFKVPFDLGYTFDDYGPGKTLSLEILSGLLSPEIQIAFPSTPSEFETGARRGAVILMRDEESSLVLSTNLVRLVDYRDWRLTELESLTKKTDLLEADGAARWEQIEKLTGWLKTERAQHESLKMNVRTLFARKEFRLINAISHWPEVKELHEKC